MDWNCSQEHRDGGIESGDRGVRTVGGNHERREEWWKRRGRKTLVVEIKQARMEAFQNVMNTYTFT